MSDQASHIAPLLPHDTPSWGRALFQEIHRLNCKIEALHATLALQVVDRKEAAAILECSTKTVYRYEKQDRLPLANVAKPGAHYFRADVLNLKRTLP